MANFGEDTGIPTVNATTQGINVRANPEEFGEGIARGMKNVGEGATKALDFYGQVAADDATNNWHKKVENILYGDPNDPDGSPGYYNMKGADAMKARPQVMQELEQAAQEQRGTLFTSQSKFQFDQDTRRSRFLIDQQVGSHYEQQQNEWTLKTNADKVQAAEDAVSRNPTDPATLGLALTQAREAAIRVAQQTRGSDFDPQAEINKADQGVRLKQFDALRVTNPQMALDLARNNDSLKSLPNYASLVHQAQEDAANQATATTSDAAINDWKGKAAQSIAPPTTPTTHTPTAPAQYNPALEQVNPKWRGAVGNILAGETVGDPASAGPAGDYRVAGLGQFTTDQWETVTGHKIAPHDVGVKGKDPRLDPMQSVAALGNEMMLNDGAYQKQFGHPANAGDLAIMHQQGQHGGLKLLGALVDHANDPASNYVSAAALTQNKIPEDATVAQAVRHIATYYTKGQAEQIGPTEAQYTSQSDYLMSNLNDAVDKYREDISKNPAFEGREDLIDRSVQSFENRYRRTIRDQNSVYLQDTHMLQSAIVQNHLTSENEVMALSPDMAAAWMRLQFENPGAVESMRKWFNANAGGVTKSFGTQFSNVLDRTLAPVGDPNRIQDPAQINTMLGRGESALITNTGANVLQQILTARNQPGGENDFAQLRTYLAKAKTTIDPMTKPELGQVWPEGQQKYQRFVGGALQIIAHDRQEGVPMSETLKKGGAVDQLLAQSGMSLDEQRKSRGQIVHDAAKQPELKAAAYLRKSADVGYLQEGIKQKIISPAQAAQAIKMGARSVAELQKARAANMISYDDAVEAKHHLDQYKRNFFGQPAS